MAISLTKSIGTNNAITITWSGFTNKVSLYRVTGASNADYTAYYNYAVAKTSQNDPTSSIVDAASQGVYGSSINGSRSSSGSGSYTDEGRIASAAGTNYYYIATDGINAAIVEAQISYNGAGNLNVDATLNENALKAAIYNASESKAYELQVDSGNNYIVVVNTGATAKTADDIKTALTTAATISGASVSLISSGNLDSLTGYKPYFKGTVKVGYTDVAAGVGERLAVLTAVTPTLSSDRKGIDIPAIANANSTKSTNGRIQYKTSSASTWTTWTDTNSSQAFYARSGGYKLTNLTAGAKYNIRICAIGDGDYYDSPYTNLADITVPIILTTPSSFAAQVGDGQILLTWSAVTNAASYKVYYREDGEDDWEEKAVASGTSTSITDLTNGTKYNFKIVAIAAANSSYANSEESSVISSTPNAG